MESIITNRMEPAGNKQGRPTNAQIRAREKPQALEVVDVPPPIDLLPRVLPMRCLCCGRGMVPRITRTRPNQRVITCSLCNGRMTITYRTTMEPLVEKI